MTSLKKLRSEAARAFALAHDALHARVTDRVKAAALINALDAIAAYTIATGIAVQTETPESKPDARS